MTVWIILWHYGDNSGFGVIERAYASEEEARWQVDLLCKHADSKRFSLLSLEMDGPSPDDGANWRDYGTRPTT